MAFYDITPVKLAQAAMTNAYATVYTTPVGTRTFVKDITIVNTTASPIGIYVSLVPSGSNASANNAVFYNNSLPGNTTVEWCGAQIMNGGDTIQIKGSTTGCTFTASGGEAV